METQFFIIENGQQAGPFPKAALYNRGLTPQTLVWHQGLSEWTPAGNVAALADVFNPQPASTQVPPNSNYQQPFQQQQPYQQPYQQPGQAYGQHHPYGQNNVHTNYQTLAIIATIVGALFSCIGMIFGIIAITKSNEANRYFMMGDEMNGNLANNSAKTNVIIAFVLAGIGLVANIGILSAGLL